MELVMPLKKKEVMAVFEPADRKLTEIIDENIDRDGFFRYLRHNWHLAGTLVAKTNITDEELHQVRKILKDSCYNLSIFTSWLQEGNEAFADTDELDKMATRLGAYQDLTVSLNMLRKFLAGEVADRERNALAHLEEELTRRRVNERQQLLQMLKGYFSVSPE
jgi:CHAD domain-containing protein